MIPVRPISLTIALCATTVAADFDPDAYPRYETCALCHGLFGTSHTAKFPNLAAQDPTYIANQLRAFLVKDRTNDSGQMAAIVLELQEGDIDLVVDWFASQDPPTPDPAADTSKGLVVYADLGCGACHDNVADMPGVPYLTAQHAGYLAKQMEDFKTGDRGLGPMAIDHAAILPNDKAAIDALAIYLAAEPRQ